MKIFFAGFQILK